MHKARHFKNTTLPWFVVYLKWQIFDSSLLIIVLTKQSQLSQKYYFLKKIHTDYWLYWGA